MTPLDKACLNDLAEKTERFTSDLLFFGMTKPFRLPNADEQAVLDGLEVRLISPEEQPRWEQEVSEHHYLKNAILVGERLRYVVTFQGQWLARMGWSAPARHLRARDQWIGWSADQLARRRPLLANNAFGKYFPTRLGQLGFHSL